jgi:hypothetical protein
MNDADEPKPLKVPTATKAEVERLMEGAMPVQNVPEVGTPENAKRLSTVILTAIRESCADDTGTVTLPADDILSALIDATAMVVAQHPSFLIQRRRRELVEDIGLKLQTQCSALARAWSQRIVPASTLKLPRGSR